ncbi:MAG: thioredoxin domain-containing protein [Patescibacteria group bacterium]
MRNLIIIISTIILFILIGFWVYGSKNKTESKTTASTTGSASNDIKITISETDHIKGDSNATLTLVEYSDFQCPYCVSFQTVMERIVNEYSGKVRWVYRYFPLPSHPAAKDAAIAAEAAGRQGKFWEFSQKIIEKSQPDGTGLKSADLSKYAEESGLDMAKFKDDIIDRGTVARVESDIASGNELGVRGTPATYLIDKNGKIEPLSGALSFKELKAKVEAALAK